MTDSMILGAGVLIGTAGVLIATAVAWQIRTSRKMSERDDRQVPRQGGGREVL